MIESENALIDNEAPIRAAIRIENDGRAMFEMHVYRSSEQTDGDVAKTALETYLGARHREHSHALAITKVDGVARCELGETVFTARVSA